MSSDLHNYGIIGFTSDNVGIDRRIYTGLTSTDPVLNVSYNGGRVDVYLNGIKLVGDHSEMPSGTRDYTFTQTGQGSSIQLRTGVALVSADVVECIGHVSGSGKTVSTYTPSVSAGNNTFNSSTTGMTGFTLAGSDLLNVYLNGVLLDSSDYTSDASADSVAITNLASGDVVHIQVIGALDYANFVPAGGGTFSGNVAVNGNLTVDTNTLKVDSSNNKVGIGTSDPKSEQHTEGTALITGSANSFQSEQTSVIFGRHGRTDASTDRRHTISQKFDTASSLSNNQLNFNISATDSGTYTPTKMMTLDGTGDVTIQTGNLVIGTAGQGIDFSNATDHTTGESGVGSVLDDYEEGSWTPTLNNSGSATVTFAKYRKVGNMVTVWARLGDLNCPSYSATTLTIGTPVATLSTDEYVGGSIMGNQINRSGMLTCSPYIYLNNFYFYFTADSSGGWSTLKWSDFNTSGSTDLFFCATYPCQ